MKAKSILQLYFIVLSCCFSGCKKYLEVDKVPDLISAADVYSTDGNASAAVAGLYRTLREFHGSNPYNLTIITGLSGDELYNFSPSTAYDEFRTNRILQTNAVLPWQNLYKMIYQANAIIEGVTKSTTISTSVKIQSIAESKFLRAYCYLNLVNLFGEVPVLTQTDVNKNANAGRTTITTVYDQIIRDLKESANDLPANFVWNGNNRTRVISWTVQSLLARVYLYKGEWDLAIQYSTSVIGSGLFAIVGNLDSITIRNNTEAIFQLANTATDGNSEASNFIFATTPVLLCTNSLLSSFQTNDSRKTKWIKSSVYAGQLCYYPYKYKTGGIGNNENYIVLRLAEQYLIRAEAMARINNLSAALKDLNIIRIRSGITALNLPISQNALLDSIAHERRVELFAETGHRWFDLKRTGNIDQVLSKEKPTTWQPFAALYPVPFTDIQINTALVQNPGY